jgi:hypothetical protein
MQSEEAPNPFTAVDLFFEKALLSCGSASAANLHTAPLACQIAYIEQVGSYCTSAQCLGRASWSQHPPVAFLGFRLGNDMFGGRTAVDLQNMRRQAEELSIRGIGSYKTS